MPNSDHDSDSIIAFLPSLADVPTKGSTIESQNIEYIVGTPLCELFLADVDSVTFRVLLRSLQTLCFGFGITNNRLALIL